MYGFVASNGERSQLVVPMKKLGVEVFVVSKKRLVVDGFVASKKRRRVSCFVVAMTTPEVDRFGVPGRRKAGKERETGVRSLRGVVS